MQSSYSSNNYQNLKLSSFIILERLGRGSTSYVFKTQSIRTKKYYAMKVMDKSEGNLKDMDIHREIEINRQLKHENIVEFVAHLEDNENHYLVTEYCDQGQITKMLLRNSKIDIFDNHPDQYSTLIKIAFQTASALNYMHKEVGIAHGDIKLANILLTKQKTKLCDFGFSTKLHGQQQQQSKDNGVKGTFMYLPPELINASNITYHKQADIWSLGICLLILILKKQPYVFTNNQQLNKSIALGNWIRPVSTPPQYLGLLNLIKSMLEINPEKRIKSHQIINHSIFNILQHSPNKQSGTDYEDQSQKALVQRSKSNSINTQSFDNQSMNKSEFNCTTDSETNFKYEIQNCEDNMQYRRDKSGENSHGLVLQECSNRNQGSDLNHQTLKYQKNQYTFDKNKICTINLGSQPYKIKNVDFLEIKTDKKLRVKINKANYCIDSLVNYLLLEVPKKMQQQTNIQGQKYRLKKYRYDNFMAVSKQNQPGNCIQKTISGQIDFNQRILNYYQYAKQLIDVLKKNEGIIYENVHPSSGNFYWIRRIKDNQQFQISVHFHSKLHMNTSGVVFSRSINENSIKDSANSTKYQIEIKKNDEMQQALHICINQVRRIILNDSEPEISSFLNFEQLKQNIRIFEQCLELCYNKLRSNF